MPPHETGRYRALLTDLDGVIRMWRPDVDTDIERRFGLPPGSIKGTAFETTLLHRAITGEITDEAWRAEVAAMLGRRFPDADTQAAVACWSESPGEVNWPVLDLLRSVRQTVPVVLVTNATSRLTRDLDALGLLDAFDQVINSSDVGHAKPEPEIYRRALAAAAVSAAEGVYLDDSPTNVAVARMLGIAGHVVSDDPAPIAAILSAAGLLPPEPDRSR